MKLTMFLTPLIAALAFIDNLTNYVLTGLTGFLHRTFSTVAVAITDTLDRLFPMADFPVLAGHPFVAGRDVTYLTMGVHRKAQPANRIGPEDDDEGDDDEGDEDAIRGHYRG